MATEEPSEAELRAAYEAEIKKIGVEQILLENIVTLINLGMRRTGLISGTEDERDPAQVRLAIESVRALMPVLEESEPERAAAVREGLSQLQLAYVQIGGGPAPPASDQAGPAGDQGTRGPEPASPEPPAVKPGEPGPAQRSGRLWIPGQ